MVNIYDKCSDHQKRNNNDVENVLFRSGVELSKCSIPGPGPYQDSSHSLHLAACQVYTERETLTGNYRYYSVII